MTASFHRYPVLGALVVLGARESVAESADPGAGRFGFDCESDYSRWETLWSEAKRRWCCQYVKRGCSATNTTFNCQKDLDTWQSKWSKGKKEWCCENKGLGCRWACLSDSDLWSPGHRTWCCKHHKQGCLADEEQKGHFDCQEGVTSWRTDWSDKKKAFCCKSHPPNGCGSEGHFNCSLGQDTWQMGWPVAKKEWCCRVHPPRGCPRTEPYDCAAGNTTWQTSWTAIKKRWCCTRHPPCGCPEAATTRPARPPPTSPVPTTKKPPSTTVPTTQQPTTPAPPAVTTGPPTQPAVTTGPPTQPAVTAAPPAATAGTPSAQPKPVPKPGAPAPTSPAPAQQAPTRQPTTQVPQKYDCFEDFEQRTTWCKKKVCWCCEFHGVACPPVYYPPNVPENVVICKHVPHEEAAKEAAQQAALNAVQSEQELMVGIPELQHTQHKAVLVGGLTLMLACTGLLIARALGVHQRSRRGIVQLVSMKEDVQDFSLRLVGETSHLMPQDLRAS